MANKNNEVAIATQQNNSISVFTDFGQFNNYMTMAETISKSQMIPVKYQGKPQDCLVGIDFALRTGMNPLMVLQNLDIVQGKPSWSGSACIALINNCGKFSTELDWEMETNHNGRGFAMRAFATRKSDNKVVYGSWVTAEMVQAEHWGAKWNSMPEQMYRYRTATFFARVYCPEVLMGYHTIEENEDAEAAAKTQVSQEEREKASNAFQAAVNKARESGKQVEDAEVVSEAQETAPAATKAGNQPSAQTQAQKPQSAKENASGGDEALRSPVDGLTPSERLDKALKRGKFAEQPAGESGKDLFNDK